MFTYGEKRWEEEEEEEWERRIERGTSLVGKGKGGKEERREERRALEM